MNEKFDINQFMKIFENSKIKGDKIFFAEKIHEAINYAAQKYSFDILKSITAVDTGEGIELTYRLYSTLNDEEAQLSTIIKSEAQSVTDIYKSAIADENEIYDMFGVNFIGNEGLKRLYMPEDWKGFPLKKDYIEDDTRLAWNDDKNDI